MQNVRGFSQNKKKTISPYQVRSLWNMPWCSAELPGAIRPILRTVWAVLAPRYRHVVTDPNTIRRADNDTSVYLDRATRTLVESALGFLRKWVLRKCPRSEKQSSNWQIECNSTSIFPWQLTALISFKSLTGAWTPGIFCAVWMVRHSSDVQT